MQSSSSSSSLQWSDFGLVSIGFLVFALCGLITVVINLAGWAHNQFGMIPRVDDLRGLMTSVLLLTVAGMTAPAIRTTLRSLRNDPVAQ